MHSRGLKLGVYLDIGTRTCQKYPGSQFYMQMDAQSLAEWGVDMVKLDACTLPVSQFAEAYVAFGTFLNQTGRQILYSCSWPADQLFTPHPIQVRCFIVLLYKLFLP